MYLRERPWMFRFVEPPKNFQNYVEFRGEVGNYQVRGICSTQSEETILYFPELLFVHNETNEETHFIPLRHNALLSVDLQTTKLTLRGIAICPQANGHIIGLY